MGKTSADYARERHERGKCCQCGKDAIPGTYRCEVHTAPKTKAKLAAPAAPPDDSTQVSYGGAVSRSAYDAARYQARVDAGRCPAVVDCLNPRAEGSVYCEKHLNNQREREHKRAAKRAAAKLAAATEAVEQRAKVSVCLGCATPNIFANGNCRKCEAARLRHEEGLTHYASRLRVGLCQRCPAVVPIGTPLCDASKGKKKAQVKQKCIDRICLTCNKIIASDQSGQKCKTCREEVKAEKAARKAAGLCPTFGCTEQPVKPNGSCAKHREANRQKSERRYARLRKEVFDAYGNVCVCCGEPRQPFLSIDHINNDGAEHRRKLTGKQSGSTWRVYNDIRKQGYPKDQFQILCRNCNSGKELCGVCPHETERQEAAAALAALTAVASSG